MGKILQISKAGIRHTLTTQMYFTYSIVKWKAVILLWFIIFSILCHCVRVQGDLLHKRYCIQCSFIYSLIYICFVNLHSFHEVKKQERKCFCQNKFTQWLRPPTHKDWMHYDHERVFLFFFVMVESKLEYSKAFTS